LHPGRWTRRFPSHLHRPQAMWLSSSTQGPKHRTQPTRLVCAGDIEPSGELLVRYHTQLAGLSSCADGETRRWQGWLPPKMGKCNNGFIGGHAPLGAHWGPEPDPEKKSLAVGCFPMRDANHDAQICTCRRYSEPRRF